MRHSLLLRLLALSLGVASLAVLATALLATYGTGTQLRDEVESGASLLETDSHIRSSLLTYADNHDSWAGVEPLVRELAEETGRRIALATPDGETITDSAELLGQGSGELPSTRAARLDAAEPPEPFARGLPSFTSELADANIAFYGWQMTDQEVQGRQGLVDEAMECLREEGIDATIRPRSGSTAGNVGLFLTTAEDASGVASSAAPEVQACLPDDLFAPSAAARELNEQTVDQTVACLEQHDLAHQVSEDTYGMQIVEPKDGEAKPATWRDCEQTAQVEAKQPYVAPQADLYLGASDRFNPFSPQGWWRTAVTAASILLVAAAVTVLAGRRLVQPILALTAAARRMTAGDHRARVPVSGHNEVTRLGHAFNVMADSIESSAQQRRALVSDVAHELRNPLANVRSHLEAVEDGIAPLDATLVQSLREESSLLERLVADLQDLALADAGMLPIHLEERDAADLANHTVAAYQAHADASGVAVHVDAPAPVPVRADPARLRQALGNLVSNAVTHTPTGGTVEVAVRRLDGSVALTVTDTGQGIAPEHLPHLFDRFYRADPSRSRSTGGSGLGLAITKHLVEAHGGSVEAASTPGLGSTFTIRLPDATPPQHSPTG